MAWTAAATDWWFTGYENLLRVLVVGAAAYPALILILRATGKRTLSKMNAFDLVITVAFGSALASTLLSPSVTVAQGVTAFAFLALAQLAATWLSVRAAWFRRLIKAQPTLLYYRGRILHDQLRRERVTRVEVQSAARQQGLTDLNQVAAVVLETDGSLSVLTDTGDADEASFIDHLRRGRGGGD